MSLWLGESKKRMWNEIKLSGSRNLWLLIICSTVNLFICMWWDRKLAVIKYWIKLCSVKNLKLIRENYPWKPFVCLLFKKLHFCDVGTEQNFCFKQKIVWRLVEKIGVGGFFGQENNNEFNFFSHMFVFFLHNTFFSHTIW